MCICVFLELKYFKTDLEGRSLWNQMLKQCSKGCKLFHGWLNGASQGNVSRAERMIKSKWPQLPFKPSNFQNSPLESLFVNVVRVTAVPTAIALAWMPGGRWTPQVLGHSPGLWVVEEELQRGKVPHGGCRQAKGFSSFRKRQRHLPAS